MSQLNAKTDNLTLKKNKTVQFNKDTDELQNVKKEKLEKTIDTDCNTKHSQDDMSESSTLSHLKSIDIYDRLKFKKLGNRNKYKTKTAVISKPKITIEKFSDEITKYVEEMAIDPPVLKSRDIKRQRTIKFSTQKTTYSYVKEIAKDSEEILGKKHDNDTADLIPTTVLPEEKDEEDLENNGEEKKESMFSFDNVEDDD